MRPRLLVVDDDAFARLSVASVLRLHGFDVVAEAADAAGAMSLLETTDPDALITDLDLGMGPSGADLVQAARRVAPTVAVLVLTSYRDPRLVDTGRTRLPDDVAYLVKSDVVDATVLVDAVRRALALARSGPGLPDSPRAGSAGDASAGSVLTEAQVDLLRMIGDGLSNAEIARRRRVSVKTVEGAINRLAHRLGVTSSPDRNQRVELTRVFLRMAGQVDAR